VTTEQQIWIFPFPLETPDSFVDVAGLVRYLTDEIFTYEACRLRHSLLRNASDGDLIILSQSGQLYGHFEITRWEEPNDDDRRVFPRIVSRGRVYIVGKSWLYGNPVPLSSIGVTGIQYGKTISDDTFRQLLSLAGPTSEFSAPQLPESTIELERVLRAVKARLGQCEFRQQLLKAYDGRCAISGYDAQDALEAAHIDAYAGRGSNETSNGILLRGDLHSLFDLDLLAIDPETLRVSVGGGLLGTRYAELDGIAVSLPASAADYPSPDAIGRRWQRFTASNTKGGAEGGVR
jgi:HNH endonuclease